MTQLCCFSMWESNPLPPPCNMLSQDRKEHLQQNELWDQGGSYQSPSQVSSETNGTDTYRDWLNVTLRSFGTHSRVYIFPAL